MWPFKRQPKTGDNLPKEIKEYYDSEHRERVGVAWLVAFLSLIITVVIVVGIAFAGRWAYRKIVNKDKSGTSEVQKPAETTKETASGTSKKGTNKGSKTSSGSTETSLPATPAPQSSTAASSTSAGKLTDTGPGDTLAVFIAVSVLAAIGHGLITRKKLTN